MRLDVLNRGYGPGTKLLFVLIRLFSRHPVPDAAKLVFYRPDFYGSRAKEFTHEAMRGPSSWSVGDRELMAAYVSQANESAFCIGAHSATARQAYQSRGVRGRSQVLAQAGLPVARSSFTGDAGASSGLMLGPGLSAVKFWMPTAGRRCGLLRVGQPVRCSVTELPAGRRRDWPIRSAP
jgi:AhpD family alkylhydroperoxidase